MQRPLTNKFFAYALISTLLGSLISLALPSFQPTYGSHENITFNVSGDEVTEVYNPGDSVAIEGIIDTVVTNEDVTVRIEKPTGSTDHTENLGHPTTQGNFDYVYEIPNSAIDGVWTFEVEYDNEKAYSYFIVDDNSDTITIELIDHEDGIYEAGDEVTISGFVHNEDSASEPNVLITVLDPTNDMIVDEADAELGDGSLDSDVFEYSFDLDNDASHGRYAVIVTYDVDDQEGSKLFEILDEDAGSSGGGNGDSDTDGDLSAQVGEVKYEPGDTVTLTGSIDQYDSGDNEDLGIVVEDPNSDAVDDYGDDTANVQSDGDFDYDFNLADDAEDGTYTIIITYASDEVQMTFEVEAAAGGGSTSDLTAKLNKLSFLAGETMTITGTVPKILSDETINIQVYRPDATPVLSAYAYVEPSSSRTYTATLSLPLTLKVAEKYKVKIDYNDDQLEVLFSITGQSSDTSGGVITVKTDSLKYTVGSTVKISGKVAAASIITGEKVLIQVFNPEEALSRTDPVDLASDGSFTYEFPLAGQLNSLSGNYQLIAVYDLKKAKSTFEVEGGSEAHKTYDLKVQDKTFTIEYDVSGGSIKSMFVKPSELKLVISIDAQEDGQLTLVLPRNVIDAAKNGTDVDYLVTSTDIEAGVEGDVDVSESEVTQDSRTIVIDYKQGTDLIEISGTSIVPEFGPISGIILATAIAIVIAAFARFQKVGFDFLNKN